MLVREMTKFAILLGSALLVMQCGGGSQPETTGIAIVNSSDAGATGGRRIFTRLPDTGVGVETVAVAPKLSPQPAPAPTPVAAVSEPATPAAAPVSNNFAAAVESREVEIAAPAAQAAPAVEAPVAVAVAEPAAAAPAAPAAPGQFDGSWRFDGMAIVFSGGQYRGNSGCNDFSGSYLKWFGSKVQILPMKFSGDTCDNGDVAQNEIRLEEGFPGTYEVIFDGANMILSNDKGSWFFSPAS